VVASAEGVLLDQRADSGRDAPLRVRTADSIQYPDTSRWLQPFGVRFTPDCLVSSSA
jgi:hypothetical protein